MHSRIPEGKTFILFFVDSVFISQSLEDSVCLISVKWEESRERLPNICPKHVGYEFPGKWLPTWNLSLNGESLRIWSSLGRNQMLSKDTEASMPCFSPHWVNILVIYPGFLVANVDRFFFLYLKTIGRKVLTHLKERLLVPQNIHRRLWMRMLISDTCITWTWL